jgi:protein-disulfide isomerase
MRGRRLLLLGIALAAAAVLAVVLVVVATTSSKKSAPATISKSTPVRALLAGIPQHGLELGRSGAPETLVEFADPQCPFCATWSKDTFPTVVRDYVRTGRLKLQYRGLHFLGPDSLKALRAIIAASFQNKLWNIVEALYERQGPENSGWVTDKLLREVGASIPGLDVAAMMGERDSNNVTALITADDELGIRLGVNATPSFFVERPPALPQLLRIQTLEPAGFTAALDVAIAG